MDFEFYRNFITVAETGNISSAAKRLSLVQPALSAQLKTLEAYYGTKLFKTSRGKRQIELTEAGEAFLLQARQLCATEDSLNLTMQSYNKKNLGTISFGCSPMRSSFFLNRYLLPFAKAHPQIHYQFQEATVDIQQQQMQKGLINFAFANAPLPSVEDIQILKIRTEGFYLIYHQSMALKLQLPLQQLSQLQALPLACNYGSYPLLRTVFQEEGLQPNIAFIGTTAANAITYAATGLAVALVAAQEEDPLPPHMVKEQVFHPKLKFDQVLYWSTKNRLSPAGRLFLDFLQV